MDEDVSAKAPVTRLRRRLSVEQSEESKSPAPSTPTKKRVARSAKPQLDLIEEHGPEKTPNKRATRKSIVRDVVEEEKPLTPSRRSARIRSSTSIMSDTPQNYDSPRAKRATRRNSQVGSDNETPATSTTPARTRRTRIDSATNIEKPADSTLIADVISEEPENEPSKLSKTPDNSNDNNISPNSLRKSTRLQAKQEKRLSEIIDDESSIRKTEIKTPQKEAAEEQKEIKEKTPYSTPKKQSVEANKADLSLASHNLIEDSCKLPLKTSNAQNKSLSSLKEPEHNKRTRTRSCTTIAMSPTNNSSFLSDNESAKKKVKSNCFLNYKNRETGAGDSVLINTSIKQSKDISELTLNRQTSDSLIEKTHNVSKSEQEGAKTEINDVLKTSDTQKLFEISPETVIRTKVYIDDSDSNTDTIDRKRSTEDQCVPVVPDVFGNQSNSPTLNQVDSSVITKQNRNNQSCEPMDIDETMPENVVLNDSDDKSLNMSLKINPLDVVDSGLTVSKRKSSTSNSFSEDVKEIANTNLSAINNSRNSSKRKSTSAGNETSNDANISTRKSLISNSITAQSNKSAADAINKSKNKSMLKYSLSNSFEEDVNKTANENKSTLVLSQLKENDSLTPANSKKDISLNVTDTEKNHKVLHNIYSTSTPLQDKITSKVIKQRLPINVSDIKTKQNKESDTSFNKTQSSDEESSESDSDNEVKDSSKLIIDEADEASDNYESGDSQDDEERQYERENEIINKGETLTSDDDDVSNDTDYERDSFVVSADEEDNELLDGYGDDLTLSDKELTMSAKSKKKYNERKSKEQKQASRKMFEARHSANNSKKGQRLDSKLLESDEESMKSKPRKTNRLRLNSSQDTSVISTANESIKTKKKLSKSTVDSDADESITIKKKRVKCLSDSVHDHLDEKEISIYGTELTEKDPLQKVKEEPKTPHQSFVGEDIENLEIDENVSIMKSNQSRDPLQSTILQEKNDDKEEDDESDLSSNPEITSDYTNLLNNLNNINKKEKKKDTSLNDESKKDPIIDQVNLTLTKNKCQNEVQEDSSDSIDMKLLFTDDSNDSENQPKANESKLTGGEDFIPLKRTEAKTNIHEEGDSYKSTNESFNKSLKKKKKGKESMDKSPHISPKKHKEDYNEAEDKTNSDSNKSKNESFNKSLKKKKKGKESMDKSSHISPKKNKEDDTETGDETNKSIHNVTANQSLNTSSKRKKNDSISAFNKVKDLEKDQQSSLNESSNKSLNTSKKKKKDSISITDGQTVQDPVLLIHDTTGKSKQKKKSLSQSDDTGLQVSFNTSIKKKNKKHSVSEDLEKSANTSIKSNKKKHEEDDDDLPEEISYKSTKNKSLEIKADPTEILNTSSTKKGMKQSNIFTPNQESFKTAAALYDSDESPENKSKKQSALPEPDSKDATDNVYENSGSENKKRKGKKNQKTKDNSNEEQLVDDNQHHEDTRKRKLSAMSSVESTKEGVEDLNVTNNSSVKHKTKKQKLVNISDVVSIDANIKCSSKENRKRKERDGDIELKAPKVIKDTRKQEVSRLPVDIISKLGDKPDKLNLEKKKATIVSTSEFVVETAKIRKNKPSHYLEESIYLNQDSPEKNKEMRKIKKPKVLPFVPTATTSGFGFTTNFKVSVIPTETKFEAKSTQSNFKNDYLQKKLKKFGTYELLKTQRKVKMSKF